MKDRPLSSLRAVVTNIGNADSLSEHNHVFSYWTAHPREAIFEDNYFLPLRNFFSRGAHLPGQNPYQAGDEIRVMAYGDDGSWSKCRIEVRHVDEHKVVVEQIEDWRTGGGEAELKLDAKYRGFGEGRQPVWDVFHESGKPYRMAVSKAEAERLTGKKLGRQDAEAA